MQTTININGKLLDFTTPKVMAIINVTTDSFARHCTNITEAEILRWAAEAMSEGADILDIGACSTRPGSTPVSEDEEWRRLEPALRAIRSELPDAVLSIDTFRPEIARRALESFGRLTINDISGGCMEMFDIVRAHSVPYIWTLRGDYSLPVSHPELQDLDLILDPGLGFIGSVEKDYNALRRLDELRCYNRPILVGLSRKSMIYKPLGLTPDTCLTPTQALHLYALEHGADILRTHDVKETKQIVDLWNFVSQK